MGDNDRLPDGTRFASWEAPAQWSRTYHVAQNHPAADDANPGTAERPWLTIGRAAAVLRPGERVTIHAGVYREWVKPARGGEAPDRMVGYEAAPGEDVVLKGSDLWTPQWEPTQEFAPPGGAQTWCAQLGGSMFAGANPFCLQNFTFQPDPQWKQEPGFDLRRGQLFRDGEPLTQVGDYEQLGATQNAFWVAENGGALHVRLAEDEAPEGKTFEITTREQVFAPTLRGLSYIRLSGLRVLHAGNGIPIPPPQRGAISATQGTHWIIEDCEVGHANTIGIDLGGQWWTFRGKGVQGWHIVRRCNVHHCGIAGLCAWHNVSNQSLLIEDNLIADNGLLPCTNHFETGGIKIHFPVNSLIRRNVFLRNRHSAALWLDGFSTNVRITQNVFADTSASPFGSVFLEITNGPNLVDNNLIVGSQSNGLYEHDAARMVVAQNLIANGTGSAVQLSLGAPDRKIDDAHPEDDHRVWGNVLLGFERYIVLPTDTSQSEGNVLGGVTGNAADLFHSGQTVAGDLSAWQAAGHDLRAVALPLQVSFDAETLELRVTGPAGASLPQVGYPEGFLPELPSQEKLLASFGLPRVQGLTLSGRLVPLPELLEADLLGKPRDGGSLQAGCLVDLPLDGTAVRVDPRRRR
ncbi:MAG: right-handed parallel beta-helix repeat-containing protein [Armatimonadetes bacterium]|nr:right-handed parallel beta-helix repeat-containing protein [Armatimonadota bacterium]